MQNKNTKNDKIGKIAAIITITVLSLIIVVFGVLIVLEKTGVLYPADDGDSVIVPPEYADKTPYADGDYEYMLLKDGTAIIVSWLAGETGAESAVTPTELGGYRVSAVAGYVFAMYPKLKDVTFSEGITYIGEGVLNGTVCSVSLPSTLEQIDDSAFEGFTSEGITFQGTAEQWRKVKIGRNNTAVLKVKVSVN